MTRGFVEYVRRGLEQPTEDRGDDMSGNDLLIGELKGNVESLNMRFAELAKELKARHDKDDARWLELERMIAEFRGGSKMAKFIFAAGGGVAGSGALYGIVKLLPLIPFR